MGFHPAPAFFGVGELQAQAFVELDGFVVTDGGGKQGVRGCLVNGGVPHLHRVVDGSLGDQLQGEGHEVGHLRHSPIGHLDLLVIGDVEACVKVLHRDQPAAAPGVQDGQHFSGQRALPEIGVDLPDVIGGVEDVMVAGHVTRDVLGGKLAMAVEEILVLSVAAPQLHAALEPGDRHRADDEGLVRMSKQLERFLGVICDDRERMRRVCVVGSKAVLQQNAQASDIVANGLDVGYPEPALFVASFGGFPGAKQRIQHQGSRVGLVHGARIGKLAQADNVREVGATLAQKIGDQRHPFLVCDHVDALGCRLPGCWGNGSLGD